MGTQIGHYLVEATLGEGGMGEVYLARDLNLERKVAIKTLVPSKNSAKLEKRFENEAKILASLNHGNIVSVYNYGRHEGTHFMVMELIEGQDLSSILKSRGFGIGECLETFQQMVEGILEAHSQGVLHRDIKPANVVIDTNGKVKIVDFGISKDFKKEDLNLTDMGKVIGTTNYMAPELLIGQRPSSQSDIFSLGIVLYEMLEGINPFTAETRFQTMDNIRNFNPRLSAEVQRVVPPELETILYKMLQKDPNDRYQNMNEIKENLLKIDLLKIPSELMAAKRPEVMILNEHKVRMKLLSRGFATREIGIILSLAAQIQEGDKHTADQTEVVIGENQKISLSQEALEMAIKRFKSAQLQLSASREMNFTKDFFSLIKQRTDKWSRNKKVTLGVVSLCILVVFPWFYMGSKNNPILSLEAPAPKVQIASGSEWKTRTRLLDKKTGDLLQDTIRHLIVKENELGEQITETIDVNTGKRAISSMPVNPFVPSHTFQTVAGDEGKQVLLGELDDIFPIQTGKVMQYEAQGKSKWDGKFSYKKQCKVVGTKILNIKLGKVPTWVVNCKSIHEKTGRVKDNGSFRKLYYSPTHGNFVKSEASWETDGKMVVETKEWIDDSKYFRPNY